MPTPTNSDVLAANAISVADSAEVLFLTCDANIGTTNEIAGKTFIGAAVLCSFGIEMLLKTIHSYLGSDTTFPSGHDLRSLFDSVTDREIKDSLAAGFNSTTGRDLVDFLNSHRKAFQDWRYFSESTSNINFDVGDARALTKLLKSTVTKLTTR